MRKTIKDMRLWLSAAVLVTMAIGCDSIEEITPDPEVAQEETNTDTTAKADEEDVEPEWEEWAECTGNIIGPHDRFEMKYFKTACALADPDENVVVSPASVKVMLATLGEASDEVCQREIARQMGYESFEEVKAARDFYLSEVACRYEAAAMNLNCDLTKSDNSSDLSVANNMWFRAPWNRRPGTVCTGLFNGATIEALKFVGNNAYVKTETYQAFSKNTDYSGFIYWLVLPESGVDINELIRNFDPEILERNCCGRVELTIPKFIYTDQKSDVYLTLKSIGFKHMENVNMQQHTEILMTEYGMQEGASDAESLDGFAVSFDTTATMTFDRPFLLFVTEPTTGGCLMAAKIAHL